MERRLCRVFQRVVLISSTEDRMLRIQCVATRDVPTQYKLFPFSSWTIFFFFENHNATQEFLISVRSDMRFPSSRL